MAANESDCDQNDPARRRMESCMRRLLAEDSIEFASGEQVERFADEVSEILCAIAEATDEPGMAHARVSDESCLCGFFSRSDGPGLARLSARLGRAVQSSEPLWQVAAWLRENRRPRP